MCRRKPPAAQTALLALTFAAALWAPAFADPVTAELGLSLNPTIGSHRSFNDRTTIVPVPVPILEARVRAGPFEIEAFGLPALASVPHSDAIQGPTSTRLGAFDGTARVYDPLHRFSAGIGETLYTQATHYSDGVEILGVGETQSSRVVGAHYELGYHTGAGKGRLDAYAALAPVMRGTQFTAYDVPLYRVRVDPEVGDQVSFNVRWERALAKRSTLFFGLRYVNYTARYDEPSGTLSDRNVGLLPAIGMRWQIGR
ncbi:MAG: hypothetical protein WCE44_11370 [Candidatus Velthaea sp.]|jgi:hypothetical protein